MAQKVTPQQVLSAYNAAQPELMGLLTTAADPYTYNPEINPQDYSSRERLELNEISKKKGPGGVGKNLASGAAAGAAAGAAFGPYGALIGAAAGTIGGGIKSALEKRKWKEEQERLKQQNKYIGIHNQQIGMQDIAMSRWGNQLAAQNAYLTNPNAGYRPEFLDPYMSSAQSAFGPMNTTI